MSKIVWVLGAGFSRSLGAPLLDDLFSEQLDGLVRAAYGDSRYPRLYSQAAKVVRRLYREHHPRHWRDAEEFLDRLDLAARAPDSAWARSVLSLAGQLQLGPEPLSALSFAARRLVAAQCAVFLSQADRNMERWGPYRHWASQVDAAQSVITFNYDTVLEQLSPKFEIVRPGDASPLAMPGVFKLHGSVNWIRSSANGKDYVEVRPDIPDAALTLDDECLAIASPGPTKQEMTEQLFEGLWKHAMQELRTASAIVFIGYRFPPSDSVARQRLIRAISENEMTYLSLHTVLGADTNGPDSQRLRSLLLYAVRRGGRTPCTDKNVMSSGPRMFNMTQHPLWAQDFLDITDVPHLYVPYSQHVGWNGL